MWAELKCVLICTRPCGAGEGLVHCSPSCFRHWYPFESSGDAIPLAHLEEGGKPQSIARCKGEYCFFLWFCVSWCPFVCLSVDAVIPLFLFLFYLFTSLLCLALILFISVLFVISLFLSFVHWSRCNILLMTYACADLSPHLLSIIWFDFLVLFYFIYLFIFLHQKAKGKQKR